MGKPSRLHVGNARRVSCEQTQGSETSQYLEEKKSTIDLGPCVRLVRRRDRDSDIPRVAASETGEAQTSVPQGAGGS